MAKECVAFLEYTKYYKIGYGNGYIKIVNLLKAIELYTKWVNFMVCEFYFNKAL